MGCGEKSDRLNATCYKMRRSRHTCHHVAAAFPASGYTVQTRTQEPLGADEEQDQMQEI